MEVFFIFLRLGLTSFGGPVAHLGYFHDEFVIKRKWLSDSSYADLVALCQFLPGPASSQVGMALGYQQASYLGALAAWLGFTLPSAVILIGFALGLHSSQLYLEKPLFIGALNGLKIAAVGIVAQAIFMMSKKLCVGKMRSSFAVVAAIAVLLVHSSWMPILVLAVAAFLGILFLKNSSVLPHTPWTQNLSKGKSISILVLFFSILFFLPLILYFRPIPFLQQFDSFFRSGALVFGGGHVVLPMLESEVVHKGWVSSEVFMMGYALAQAIPGPLFSFAAYLGALSSFGLHGISGAILCLVGIFLPSYLFILGVFPFWEKFRSLSKTQSAMQGMNAAVVGLLIAAFINPVWTTTIHSVKELIVAAFAFWCLTFWKKPSWAVILFCAIIGLFIF